MADRRKQMVLNLHVQPPRQRETKPAVECVGQVVTAFTPEVLRGYNLVTIVAAVAGVRGLRGQMVNLAYIALSVAGTPMNRLDKQQMM